MLFDNTLEVLQHFGPNAAGILNAYCCELEDALLEAGVSESVRVGLACQMEHLRNEVFAPPSNNIRPLTLAG